jgi:hypothetical protein
MLGDGAWLAIASFMTRLLILGTIVLAACTSRGTDVDLAKGDEIDPVVVSQACDRAPDDPLHLATMSVDGKTLRVKVVYTGGCEEHAFAACWDGTVLDSAPPLLHLRVHHEANGDTCEARLSHDVLIDVSDLPFEFSSAALVDPDGTIELLGT